MAKKEINDLNLRKELSMKISYDGSSRCAKTMINRALKRSPLKIYKLNERVIVRYPFKEK